jgi:hypothetical protein
MKTNALRFVLLVGLLVLLEVVEEHFSKSFTNIPWGMLIAVDGIVFVILGAITYLLFKGSTNVRIALVAGVPIVANLLLELFIGSDPAYPYVLLLLAVPYALAFGVGATAMALYQRSGDKRGQIQ